MKERDKKIIAMILVLLLGLSFGYAWGFGKGIAWSIKMGLNFVNIDLDIDEEVLAQGIFNYKNNIAACFDVPNIQTDQS